MTSLSIFPSNDNPRFSRALLLRIKNATLGKKYELSIAFVRPKEMRQLNQAYRGKDAPTDILAFPLRTAAGEILFCRDEVKRRAGAFKRTYRNYLLLLFIHGLLHLKGMEHGGRMEREERKFQKRFGI